MTNIVKFGKTVLPGEANEELVATIEQLLSDAKSGSLRALAYVTVRENNVIGSGWDGSDGTRYPLAAAISILSVRYAMALQDGKDEA
jgi:hypothetical protein